MTKARTVAHSHRNISLAAFLCISALAVPPSTLLHAQQASREERQSTIDWFINKYYYPHAICAFAGAAERAREDELLKTIRSENLRAFEAAEKTSEYAATVAKLQAMIDVRFREKSTLAGASAECTHLTEQMVFAHKRKRHDDLFALLLKLFAAPT